MFVGIGVGGGRTSLVSAYVCCGTCGHVRRVCFGVGRFCTCTHAVGDRRYVVFVFMSICFSSSFLPCGGGMLLVAFVAVFCLFPPPLSSFLSLSLSLFLSLFLFLLRLRALPSCCLAFFTFCLAYFLALICFVLLCLFAYSATLLLAFPAVYCVNLCFSCFLFVSWACQVCLVRSFFLLFLPLLSFSSLALLTCVKSGPVRESWRIACSALVSKTPPRKRTHVECFLLSAWYAIVLSDQVVCHTKQV